MNSFESLWRIYTNIDTDLINTIGYFYPCCVNSIELLFCFFFFHYYYYSRHVRIELYALGVILGENKVQVWVRYAGRVNCSFCIFLRRTIISITRYLRKYVLYFPCTRTERRSENVRQVDKVAHYAYIVPIYYIYTHTHKVYRPNGAQRSTWCIIRACVMLYLSFFRFIITYIRYVYIIHESYQRYYFDFRFEKLHKKEMHRNTILLLWSYGDVCTTVVYARTKESSERTASIIIKF